MILVEGTIRCGERDLKFQASFFTPGNAKAFITRENASGGNLRVTDSDWTPPRNREKNL